MVQNDPAKKKLWGSKVDEIEIVFLLGIPVYIHFARIKRQEGVGVGITARGWLQWNRNTKIGRIACSQVFVNLNITDYKGNYRSFYILAGKICITLSRQHV